ncbi:hypothetical protein [Myroides odoratimimus]|uniref:hypothetical protein n=1 Tax=Myroides odoratimimus TaxID=76832 RepID=UPI00091AC430|nr:hypothetical protein [Myroides odoratimimus]SHL61908.1 hypothetical protein SAMN05444275_105195 [Myroides odoratimimus subsp. xuanwuensis]
MKVNCKRILTIIGLLLANVIYACPVCERNQPKLLKGVVHGIGPDSKWDYTIIVVIAILVLATLIFSIKWLVKPGEESREHIKRTVLNDLLDGAEK